MSKKPWTVSLARWGVSLARWVPQAMLALATLPVLLFAVSNARREQHWHVTVFDAAGGAPVARHQTVEPSYEWDRWAANAPVKEAVWEACLQLEDSAKVAFQLSATDRARLLIDGRRAFGVNAGGSVRTSGGWLTLTRGRHRLRIEHRLEAQVSRLALNASLAGEVPAALPPGALLPLADCSGVKPSVRPPSPTSQSLRTVPRLARGGASRGSPHVRH